MAASVFEMFKLGVGPSSSHTVGPMRAAYLFVQELAKKELLEKARRVVCELMGSLGATGKGHSTDLAVYLGQEPGHRDGGRDPRNHPAS